MFVFVNVCIYLKMHLSSCFLMSVLLMIADGFTVKGPSGPLVVPLGGSVLLPCSVDSLLSLEDLEVQWKRSDSDTLVHLYQDGDIRPEVQHEDYSGRAHFFTERFKHGNFSLLLKNVTAEDDGQYTCTVHSGPESGETLLEISLEYVGLSGSHIMVFILCITACGSALLFLSLIYCKTHKEEFVVKHSRRSFIPLGDSVVLPCFIDPRLLTESLKVEWRRSDSQTLIRLYQNGAEDQQHDRAHFFSEKIKHGDFSLQLKNVTAEDKGQYTCTVYSGQDSVFTISTKLILGLFGNRKFVPLGDSVVLPCSINPSLLTQSLKVEWRRSDSQTLVHLYQDGAAIQQQDYRKRVNFFTEKIKDGNFSLKLKKVKAEDEGEYTCQVYSEEDSTLSFNSILKLRFVVDCTVVSLGGSVLLPCFGPRLQTDSHKVEWKRSETLVHLYQDGDIRSEEQHQDYHDRAHFFTDNIEHGNLSLRLDHMRAKDEGQYKCEVYSGQRSVFSANTTLTLRLIQTVLRLQLLLVFCPNIIMFFAFVFWGVSEGSVIETVSCCSLYIVRPLMLLWAAPYVQQFTGNIKTWILLYSYRTEYIVFSTVLYSVLFYSAWRRGLSYAGFEGIMIIVLFAFVLLFCLFYSIFMFVRISGKLSQRLIKIFNVLASIFADVLPSLQFVLLIYSFGSTSGGFFIVAVLPVILTVTNYNWDITCGDKMGCSPLVRRSVWSVMMLLVSALMMFFYIMALENEKDRVGWACKIGFLQVLWTIWNFGYRSFRDTDFPRIMPVYLFGSVGVVLISAVALMTELILKIVNGEGLIGDLRIVVFSLETLFIASVLILLVFATWITPCLQSCQARAKCKRTRKPPSTDASGTEMNPLNTEAGEAQPDSVESQT
ncbi:Butyrophilin-like protein 2 [Triplophysa tibetana]|uniref:Butyrophilin-like protein 2 n=1 Tax=Triplophysa tibetana TaxID=1572043 RepID=A0A5A9NA10_9TELE|nr:Butyrophilin-like protein 2 [Triplophysa tibetana]